ncbi:peptidase family S41 [Clostridium tepidiprofundi DSM 19306]|uniref:Peptidase family S41 n=1 Tax=Clostridium tepidiprofundi DSM 19306 TaxID=1121338 RepID=A0A151AWP3_9CLOT|nr:S41 family peptidase [Clostridium tepidiprofundi]KYH32058.1 peptidase family S41 [Clostridium tepidiprofundi DSM 19306]
MKKYCNKTTIFGIIIAIIISSTSIYIYNYKTTKNNNALGNLTIAQKLEDFRYMYNILEENYVYFDVNKRLNGYDWLANKEEFEKSIMKTKDNFEFFIVLSRILKKLNDGHTSLYFPTYVSEIRDSYNKANENSRFDPWLKILNDKSVINKNLQWEKILKKNNIENFYSSKNEDDSYSNDNFETNIIEDGKIAYLKIKEMKPIYRTENQINDVYSFFKDIKDYPYLIIDIRGNTGGTDNCWINIMEHLIDQKISLNSTLVFKGEKYPQYFYKQSGADFSPIDELASNENYPEEIKNKFKYYTERIIDLEPNNSVGFKGKIFLLVDHYVFSSAEAFASFAKGTNLATLIGEKTGGDGIGANPLIMSLPNSGLIVGFVGIMGLNPDGTSNMEMKTTPDIELNVTYLGEEGVINRTVDIIHETEKNK